MRIFHPDDFIHGDHPTFALDTLVLRLTATLPDKQAVSLPAKTLLPRVQLLAASSSSA
jgi:hypothetical protein